MLIKLDKPKSTAFKTQFFLKRLSLLILFSCLEITVILAQTQTIDSLKKIINAAHENSISLIGSAYESLAEILSRQGNFSESIEDYNKSIRIYQTIKDSSGLGLALTFEGLTYKLLGNYVKAYELFNQSLQIGKQAKDTVRIFYSYRNLGLLFQEAEDYPTAIEYYTTKQNLGSGHDWTPYYDLIGECYWHLNKIDSAVYYIQKWFIAYRVVDTSLETIVKEKSSHLCVVGELYMLQKKYDYALKILFALLKNGQLNNDAENELRILKLISDTYLAQGNYEKTLFYSTQLLSLAKKKKTKLYERNATELLWKVYDYKKLPDSAYKYYRQYIGMKDSVINYQFLTQLASVKEAAENEKKELQYKEELQRASLAKKNLLISIIVILVIGVFIFRFISLQRRNAVNEKEILKNELALQKLESEKQQAVLQHQKTELELQALRAQMNPHFIFNCLNSINRFIINNDAEKAADYLTKFAKLIRLVLEKSDKFFVSLEDEIFFLRLYMDLEKLRFEIPFQYKINLNEIDASSIMIPTLVIQPFVENAIWHGLHQKQNGEAEININMHAHDNILQCTISDNGNGIENLNEKIQINKKSLGMQLTQQRLQLVNGNKADQVKINMKQLKNEDGQITGTCVSINIPFKND